MATNRLRASVPFAACLVALALMTACTSASRTTVAMHKSQSIPREASASLNVVSVAGTPYGHQFEIEQLIRADLSRRLVDSGVFRSVSGRSDESDYHIDLRIEKVRITSPGARIMFGSMAGRSYIQVRVEVRDTISDRLISSFQTTGYGARTMIGAQSYGYDDPVREVVADVVRNLH